MQRLEIEVPKEIQDYSESFFFGLNLRQTILSGIGIAVGGIGYAILNRYFVGVLITIIAIVISSPFFILAFWFPHGMTAWAYIKIIARYISSPKKLQMENTNVYMKYFFEPDKRTGVYLDKNKNPKLVEKKY